MTKKKLMAVLDQEMITNYAEALVEVCCFLFCLCLLFSVNESESEHGMSVYVRPQQDTRYYPLSEVGSSVITHRRLETHVHSL